MEKPKQDLINKDVNRGRRCEYNFMTVNMMLLKKQISSERPDLWEITFGW